MKFSVFELGSESADRSHREVYQGFYDRAELADAVGMDAYYITEHHFDPSFQILPSPHLLIPALALKTTKIRLGVMCTILPQHHPVRVAEEIRMMDLVSDGRLEMGFGRGAQGHEQAGYGVDRAHSAELFDQSLELVTKLLRDNEVDSYDAGPWKGGPVKLVPDATQRPYPPMWMTAVSDASLAKGGQLGLRMATSFMEASEVERTLGVYQKAWAAAHNDGSKGYYASMHHIFVAETEEEAAEVARPHIENWLGDWLKIVGEAPKDGTVDKGYEDHAEYFKRISSTAFADAIAKDMVVFGTPDQVTDQLLRFAERGVDEFMGWFQFGGLSSEEANRSLKLFGTEVAPRVRAELGLA